LQSVSELPLSFFMPAVCLFIRSSIYFFPSIYLLLYSVIWLID